jgi:hypothetical protein
VLSYSKPKSFIGIAPIKLGVSKEFILLFITLSFMGAFAGYLWAEESTIRIKPSEKPPTFISFLEKGLLKVPATRDIKIGDVNGDGALDLIFTTPNPEVFWVSRGDNSGNFALPQKHGFGTYYSDVVQGESLIMGDFNGDGRDEILHFQKRRITSETNEATLYLASSDLEDEGSFKVHLLLPLSDTLISSHSQLFLFSRDVDGDNRTDFILGDSSSEEFFVLKNTSKMWTSPPQNFDFNDIVKIHMETNLPGTKRPFQVLMLDVDNDGVADILKVGEDQIFMIRGDRNRAFISSRKAMNPSPFFQSQGFSIGPNPTVIYGRLNKDDFPDLVVNTKTGKGWILMNKDGKGFAASFILNLFAEPFISLGDFNGDRLDDIVAYGGGYSGIKILLNNGEGFFTNLIERSVDGMVVKSLTVHDINRDGLSDMILTVYKPQRGLEGRVLINISQRLRD